MAPFLPGGMPRALDLMGVDAERKAFTSDSIIMHATCAEIVTHIEREAGGAAAEALVGFMEEEPNPEHVPMVPLAGLFQELKQAGVHVAILTNDDRRFTTPVLEAEGVLDLVSFVRCADDGLPIKPDADAILTICDRLQVEPAETAMIGDSASRDIGSAMAANVGSAIGVTSGACTEEELLSAGAHVVLPDVAGVPAALLRRHGALGLAPAVE